VRRWNLYQRIAVLIALGVVLHVSCQAILVGDAGGSWFAYASNSEAMQSPLTGSKFSAIVEVLVFGGHVLAWTLAALWLLADRDDD
jgi:hypothetical protein